MPKTAYIIGDADRVREKVEAAMFDHDLDRLSRFSRSLSNAVSFVVQELEERLGARTIMAGGDDVLFIIHFDSSVKEVLEDVAICFSDLSSCTMSFGVAPTIEDAYLNLRKAKASGGGIVESGLTK